MDIQQYDISLSVRVARFKELSDHDRGAILRAFVDFMKEQGIRYDFLVANTEMITKEKQ